jgi:hypothetical protein
LTGEGVQIRTAQTTDAAAFNELLHQLGYAQDGIATTATMEVTSGDRRQDAHEFYRRCSYVDQTGRSSRFLRDLNDTNPS